MKKRVVINLGDSDVRVAFLEEGQLVEFHRESLVNRSIVGNIYRGVVQDVVPGLQAAFIDVGAGRNMFLHFMDVRPEALVMLSKDLPAALEEAAQKVVPGRITERGRRPRADPSARDVPAPLKRGDTIMIQVTKSEISDKAPRVTSNLAIAGRYVVLLPFPSQSGGVSRKIAMGEERFKLKKLLQELRAEEEFSFIMRTAGLGAGEDQVRADAEQLIEQWDEIVSRFRSMKGPGLVYSDSEIVHRLVRDVFTNDIDEVVVDDPAIADSIRTVLRTTLPELAERVLVYDRREPIFDKYLVEDQLRKALHRKVWLKSGGYLIIDENEALTAIDVNTGRFTGLRDQEKTTFRTNMEAAEAIAQQIRLRDIGGIIVIDFIDMLSADNQGRVAEELRKHLRHDRTKLSIGRIGDFGVMTLTRKRKHQSLQKNTFDDCPYCQGEGMVLKCAEVWRRLKGELIMLLEGRKAVAAALVSCDPHVAESLTGEFAPHVARFTEMTGIEIAVRADARLHREDFVITPIAQPKVAPVQLPKRRLENDEVVAASKRWEDLTPAEVAELGYEADEEVAAPEVASTDKPAAVVTVSGEEEGGARRRTRRGRRGGRRRRGRRDAAAEGATASEALGETGDTGEDSDFDIDEPEQTPAPLVEETPLPVAAPTRSGRKPRPPRPPRVEPLDPASAHVEPEPKPDAPVPVAAKLAAEEPVARKKRPARAAAPAKEPAPAPAPVVDKRPGKSGIEMVTRYWSGAGGATPEELAAQAGRPSAITRKKASSVQLPDVPVGRPLKTVKILTAWGTTPASAPAVESKATAVAEPLDPASAGAEADQPTTTRRTRPGGKKSATTQPATDDKKGPAKKPASKRGASKKAVASKAEPVAENKLAAAKKAAKKATKKAARKSAK